MAKSVFTDFGTESNWVKGTTKHKGKTYSWQAKLFDEPSEYGIKEGRVSKLFIMEDFGGPDFGNTVVSYDRGWDIEPSLIVHDIVLASVLSLCENSHKRFAEEE